MNDDILRTVVYQELLRLGKLLPPRINVTRPTIYGFGGSYVIVFIQKRANLSVETDLIFFDRIDGTGFSARACIERDRPKKYRFYKTSEGVLKIDIGSAEIWIIAEFPNGWQGNPDAETDYERYLDQKYGGYHA